MTWVVEFCHLVAADRGTFIGMLLEFFTWRHA